MANSTHRRPAKHVRQGGSLLSASKQASSNTKTPLCLSPYKHQSLFLSPPIPFYFSHRDAKAASLFSLPPYSVHRNPIFNRKQVEKISKYLTKSKSIATDFSLSVNTN
jgi:hypothetical protein